MALLTLITPLIVKDDEGKWNSGGNGINHTGGKGISHWACTRKNFCKII